MGSTNMKHDSRGNALFEHLFDFGSLERRIAKLMEKDQKTRCAECGAKVPPGKAGRRCKACRNNDLGDK